MRGLVLANGAGTLRGIIMLSPIDGYVVRHLEADLDRWFAAADRVEIAQSVQPVAAFVSTLAPGARGALEHLDALVRSGRMASLWLLDMLEDWTYGFDFVGNGACVLDQHGKDVHTTVWSLGCDGSGNYHVVLPDGRVTTWYPTDGDTLDPHAVFASLDHFMWAAVHRAAVRSKQLAGDEVAAAAAAAGDSGISSMLG